MADDNAIAQMAADNRAKREAKDFGANQIRDRYQQGLKSLRSEQHQFWLNHAFIMGEQWVYWNTERRSLDQVPRDPDRVRVTINKMWPASRTVISKLVSRELSFEVPPTGADDASLKGARTAEAILVNLAREHDWEGMREDLNWYAWKGGTAAVAIEWDAQAGTPLGMTDTGISFGTGDTVETALSITDFVVEPGVRNAETAKWWIKAIGFPPETVKDMYGLKELPQSDASAAMTPFQAKLQTDQSRGDFNVPLTLVLVYFERPNPSSPEGRVISVVGDKVVDEAPWPFPFKDRLNIVIIRETRIGNRWTGETVVTMARSVQSALNQSWSSIIEHMKLAGNARLFYPASLSDQIEQLTDLPGEAIPIPDGTSPPQYTSPPQMPSWWIEQPGRLTEQMDDILGVHAASRGEAPQNIQSGLGVSILIEQDSTPIGRLSKENALAFGRLSSMALQIYAFKVKERRKSVVQTPGQPAETVHWSGKDLQGQTTAIVPTDAIVPRSRAAQQQFAKDALQMGLITTLPQFLKLAEIPGSRDILEATNPDVAKARSENAAMALGEIELPEDFDNHKIHIEEHLVFMKSAKWRSLDKKTQDIYRKHNQAHSTLDAEQLGKQVAANQMSPVLGQAAQATGQAPIAPGAAPSAPPSPDAGVNGPVTSASNELGAAVQGQNPGVDPNIIQQAT